MAVRMKNGAKQAFEETLPKRTSFKDFVLDQTFRMSVARSSFSVGAGSVSQGRNQAAIRSPWKSWRTQQVTAISLGRRACRYQGRTRRLVPIES
jgi:hypothetical protein